MKRQQNRRPFEYRVKKRPQRVKLSPFEILRLKQERLGALENQPADETVLKLFEDLKFIKECERQAWNMLAEYLGKGERVKA